MAARDVGGVLAGTRILLVDDDAEVRAAVQAALEVAGAEVVGAGSAEEALDALDWFNPVVLVSDVGMPGRDGCSLVRELRARPPERGGNLQAIALTAFSGSEVRRRVLEAGFQLHAVKPIETGALIAIVACLARRAA
jgi:CheY-like chemotaxis protein